METDVDTSRLERSPDDNTALRLLFNRYESALMIAAIARKQIIELRQQLKEV